MIFLLVQLLFLLVVKVLKVGNQVDKVSRSNVIELLSLLLQVDVKVTHVAVHVHYHVTQSKVLGVHWDGVLFCLNVALLHRVEAVIRDVYLPDQLISHLFHGVIGPVSEPINDTSIE